MRGHDIAFILLFVGLGILALLTVASRGGNNATSTPSGGFLNFSFAVPSVNTNVTTKNPTQSISQQIQNAEEETNQIEADIKKLIDAKEASPYKGAIDLQKISRSYGSTGTAEQEYVTIKASSKNTATIKVTGWTLKSFATGNGTNIGQANYLFFGDGQDYKTKQDVYLSPGETMYVSSGRSPIGESFRVNKCSGYQTQLATFNPYLNTNCPLAKDEPNNIPPTVKNDACFNYIDSFPQCRSQMTAFPNNITPECSNFITKTMNYRYCIDNHKSDADFYLPEWRMYLNRPDTLWKKQRETVVLMDSAGKIVDTYSY